MPRKPSKKKAVRKAAVKKKIAVRKAAVKKKKKPVARKTTKAPVSFGASRSAKGAKFVSSKLRGSSYQPLFDKMEKMKAGDLLPVEVPKGISARTYHNRLNSIFRRFKPKPPRGCAFSKRTMEDGRIAILCKRA